MNILIVCDHFPPAFAPRMGYLCKYLHQEGHRVDVVFERLEGDERYAYLCGNTTHEEGLFFYKEGSRGLRRKLRWVWLMLADAAWHSKDRRVYKHVVRNPEWRDYEIVLCCTYRTFPLRAARMLSKKFQIPLVVDLRDIIEQYPDKSYLKHHLPGGKIGSWLENLFTERLLAQRNQVLAEADAVVSVSPWHVAHLKRFNPDTHLIYNGYDPEIFFPAPVADTVFRVTYTGRIISTRIRNPEMLFQAVSEMKKRGLVSQEDFKLCWYVDEDSKGILEGMAQEVGIEAFMEYPGFVPATEVPEVLNRSSVLLQLANVADEHGPKGIMSTKIFEALAIGKPLLLVRDDESFLGELVRETDSGIAARNYQEVVDFLCEEYGKWKRTGSTQRPVKEEIVRQFSRKEQARSFLRLFEQVLDRRAGGQKR